MNNCVSFEVAKLLKKHGFNPEVTCAYELRNPQRIIKHDNLAPGIPSYLEGWYGAPTNLQVIEWMSSKYNYVFSIKGNNILVLKKRPDSVLYDIVVEDSYISLPAALEIAFKFLL